MDIIYIIDCKRLWEYACSLACHCYVLHHDNDLAVVAYAYIIHGFAKDSLF